MQSIPIIKKTGKEVNSSVNVLDSGPASASQDDSALPTGPLIKPMYEGEESNQKINRQSLRESRIFMKTDQQRMEDLREAELNRSYQESASKI